MNKQKQNEYITREDGTYLLKIGCDTNEEFPQVVYARNKLRITPLKQKNSYVDDINEIKEMFRNYCINEINNMNDYNHDDYLLFIEAAEKSVCFKKKSHFHYEFFLKPLDTQMSMEKHIDNLNKISHKLKDILINMLFSYSIICS